MMYDFNKAIDPTGSIGHRGAVGPSGQRDPWIPGPEEIQSIALSYDFRAELEMVFREFREKIGWPTYLSRS